MKILVVHYRYFISGGPERYLFNLKDALEKRGHEVIPFSIRTTKNIETSFNQYFVDNIGKCDEVYVNNYPKTILTYIDLLYREFYSLKVKRKLKELIRITKPDLCYLLVYKRALSPSVIDACYEMGVPIVNRISDYNTVCGASSLYCNGRFCKSCFSDNDVSLLKNRCVKNSIFFSIIRYLSIKFHKRLHIEDKIKYYVCTNGFMKEMMIQRGYNSKKLHIIPTFFKEKDEYKFLDKSICLPTNKLNLLYIGNIDESKGIYDLVEALHLLKNYTSSFHLYMVGGLHNEENKKVVNLLKNKGLESYVTFEPFRYDGKVFEYYLKTHVTVLPARWVENLPNTLIESLFFNRPVIVPQWGSFSYTTNESVAFYYEPLNYKSLFKTLYYIVNNPEKLKEKASACNSFYKANFLEDCHINKLLKLFKEAIKS